MVTKNMSIERLLFWAIPGPSLDHVLTMIGLVLLPDQLELCNTEDLINMVWSICLLSVHFLGQIRAIFYHVETRFVLISYADQLEL